MSLQLLLPIYSRYVDFSSVQVHYFYHLNPHWEKRSTLGFFLKYLLTFLHYKEKIHIGSLTTSFLPLHKKYNPLCNDKHRIIKKKKKKSTSKLIWIKLPFSGFA